LFSRGETTMTDDIILKDKNSKHKKTLFVSVIVVLIIIALTSFLGFGKFLRDYIVYDSDRAKAMAEIGK